MSNNDDSSTPDESKVLWIDQDDPAAPPPAQDTILSIETVAKMFGIGRLTLRFYEVRGLIKRRHRIGRVRVYSWADCDRVAFLMKARRAGLKLSEITPILEIADDVLGDRELGRQMCMELIKRLARRRRALDDGLGELRQLHTLLSAKPIGPGPDTERG
jgi:DNA-binding transcriptional MerR regulator